MNRRSLPYYRILITCLVLVLILAGCSRRAAPARTSLIYAFGTMVELTVLGVDDDTAAQAEAALEADFAYMHKAWHAWEDGPLGRVNHLLPSGKPFAAPPSILPLIERGRELSEQSGHLFNPAIGKLVALWGFHRAENDNWTPPDKQSIQELVSANPRMTDVHVDDIMLRGSNPAVKLDFGAFGKGYGIDIAVQHLKQMGVKNAILNAGGDLRAIGNRDGLPWRVAIRKPTGSGVFAILHIEGDESVFTSGDYERNFIYGGKRFHHIIDPRTGYPATGAHSVTVVDDDATSADAAATALLIAGPEHWHQVAKSMGVNYVLLVDESGVVHMNPEMAARVNLLNQEVEIKISEPLMPEAIKQTKAD